jgi:hypothetical protein
VLWKFAGRDLCLLASTAALWSLADSWEVASGGLLAASASVVAGLLLGLAWGFAAHEWGHLLGAVMGAGRIRIADELGSPKLFHFDADENTRRQFFGMAWGGLLLLWAQALLFALLLPWHSLAGRVGIGFAALGALFTTAVELPIVVRKALGGA